jgi:hypothetical protein
MAEDCAQEFARFHSVARSGQGSIYPGVYPEKFPTRITPEGATESGENRLPEL